MRTKEECIQILNDFNNSHLNVSKWCQENKVSRRSLMKYRSLYNEEALKNDGILKWASVDFTSDPETKDNLDTDDDLTEDGTIDLSIKIITFKLKRSSFKDDFARILHEVGRI